MSTDDQNVDPLTDEYVWMPTGYLPRMRFKKVQCPMVITPGHLLPSKIVEALQRGHKAEEFGRRCEEEIMVYFLNLGLCPKHGMVPTGEPWNEGPGGFH